MAGAYPDAPSRRMALDGDGTVGFVSYVNAAAAYEFSGAELAILNNEDESSFDTNKSSTFYVYYLFPEPREIDGAFSVYQNASNGRPYPVAVDTSTNSTQGWDGTWVTQVADMPNYLDVAVNFRTGITSIAVSVIRVFRQQWTSSIYSQSIKAQHVYGTISPGETPDRILFLDTLNSDAVFSKVLDYGEVPRGQTQQRTIKLKNNSASYTINTLQMTAEDLHLNAGGFYTFSLDDVSYQATLNTIGNLGPGATKLIYVKQSVPDAEILGIQTARFKVAHASLT